MKDCENDVVMGELYRDDPMFAAELLNDLLEDGSPAEVCVLLRQIAMGRGLAFNTLELELIAEHLCTLRSGQRRPVLAPFVPGSALALRSESDLLPSGLQDQLTSLGMNLTCESWSAGGAAS